jgi:predicted naringenin-chalcone synthase
MNLPQDTLDCSYRTLEEYRNMSSPSVLFVLEKIPRQPHLKKGLLLSFGAGFTAHAALMHSGKINILSRIKAVSTLLAA